MPKETIGDSVTLYTADHPQRKDSPEYVLTRRWLQHQSGGCLVCGDPKIQDHHGGGCWIGSAFGFFGLFGMEWSLGWSADPAKVSEYVTRTNTLLKAAGLPTYNKPITNTQEVMAFVDSTFNASVPLCEVHHLADPDKHTPDHLGHQGIGIHKIPFPIWTLQLTNDWSRWDPWAGTTGTIAVAEDPTTPGGVQVLHVHPTHPDYGKLLPGQVLPAEHPHSIAARAPWEQVARGA